MNTTLLITLLTCVYGLGFIHGASRQIEIQKKHNQTQRANRLGKENQ